MVDSLVKVTVENLACSSLVIKLRGGFIPLVNLKCTKYYTLGNTTLVNKETIQTSHPYPE